MLRTFIFCCPITGIVMAFDMSMIGKYAHCISTIEVIAESVRLGRMIILVDSEREKEGDFIMAAEMATPQAINFMIKHGSGIVCLSLTEQRVRELGLELIKSRGDLAKSSPAFTQPIDALHGVTSGVSAEDRACSIATAINPQNGGEAIKIPGHIFPIMAVSGGVLQRPGHTEASVEIVRMAGLYPAAVICEVLNAQGATASMGEIVDIAQRYDIKIGLIRDIIDAKRRDHHIQCPEERAVA